MKGIRSRLHSLTKGGVLRKMGSLSIGPGPNKRRNIRDLFRTSDAAGGITGEAGSAKQTEVQAGSGEGAGGVLGERVQGQHDVQA